MTAYLFACVVALCVGMGIGVVLTLVALWKCGVFKGYDVNDLARRVHDQPEKFG